MSVMWCYREVGDLYRCVEKQASLFQNQEDDG